MPSSVMFLITGLSGNGAERQLLAASRELLHRQWKVSVIAMISGGDLARDFDAAGIRTYGLGMKRGIPDPRSIFRLRRIIQGVSPDILHAHMIHANLLGRISRIVTLVPVLISSAHSINEGGWWADLAYRLTDSLCEITTQVSNAAGRHYVDARVVPSQKMKVIPNGVDTGRFRPNPESRARLRRELLLGDKFVWLAVGRFDGAKDYDNLVSALRNLRSNSTCLIAGDGPLRQSIEKAAHSFGLAERIRFLGVRKDVEALMAACDAYVMSSAWEGMPNVLLEAASSGLLIVATHVGGNPEIVQNEVSGFLVPPGNSVMLAAAMQHVEIMSPSTRTAMGRVARRHIQKHYSLGSIVDQWEQTYEALLSAKLNRPASPRLLATS